ncbi:MAG: HNH endonuclease signature motif containing protein, partial [Pseudonocardiaceae bacterium]
AEPDHPTGPGPASTPTPEDQVSDCGPAPARDAGGGAPTDTAAAKDSATEDGDGSNGDRGATRTGEPVTESSSAPLVWRAGVEVRVGLGTLLGRDEHPGEVAGWGPVPAQIARTMVTAQRAAQWRYAITDATGQLLLAGITRRRPHHPAPTTGELPPCRGGIVELQIPATLLTDLATDPEACGPWAGIVTDLAAQYIRYSQYGWRGLDAQDPTARFAGAALRRHVQIRDRSCVHPGCRASAQRADLDHTRDHTHGGPTTEANSGPLCRHDHQLKTVGRWRLHQPQPGHFTWTSPLRRTYHTQPPPITHDLPDPLPRPDEPDEPAHLIHYHGPILERPPPPPDPAPSPTPPDPNEPPPF